jgi:hypothetical protein
LESWVTLFPRGEAGWQKEKQEKQIDLLQGTLDLLILKTVSLGPSSLGGYRNRQIQTGARFTF